MGAASAIGLVRSTEGGRSVRFVGVTRSDGRDEFAEQIAALRASNPCLAVERVDTGVFISPETSAAIGAETVRRLDAQYGAIPLHLIGYSQGATNALRMLVNDPDLAARARSVLVVNSAAHGSEVVDGLVAALPFRNSPEATCRELPALIQPTCERLAGPLQLISAFMKNAFETLGGPIVVSPIKDFIDRHEEGLVSLTTAACDDFWRQHGDALPKDTLYLSLRTAITRPSNLPLSNLPFYLLIRRKRPDRPVERHASTPCE